MNETGLQTIHLGDFYTEPVMIQPNHAIGILYKDSSYAKINALQSGPPSIIRVLLKNMESWSLSATENFIAATLQMRFYYTTPSQYVHTVTKSIPGDVRVSIDVSNKLSLDPVKSSLLVQYQVFIIFFTFFYQLVVSTE